jgi:hypothetical protein
MIPQFMSVTHNPPYTYGDCFRASIASILEIPTEEIPHPYQGGEDEWEDRYANMLGWLKERHQIWVMFMKVRKEDLNDFLMSYDGFVLLGGRSPRGPHLVVADRNGIVHNPNPLNDGLRPDEDDNYSIGFLCRGIR